MNQNLISIVIPTRNRPGTLLAAIKSVHENLSDIPYELIIASNGDSLEEDFQGVPKSMYENTKVVRSEIRLSMRDNWGFGFTHAIGEWIYFLGDDDIIARKQGDFFRNLLLRLDVDGVVFLNGRFAWKVDIKGDFFQTDIYEPEEDFLIHIIAPGTGLNKNWEKILPHQFPVSSGRSVIRRTVLQSLQQRGLLFAGVSPDWFTGAYFAHSDYSFARVGCIWANLGSHPNSSIAQMLKPNLESSRAEAQLNAFEVHPILSSKVGKFPTTWLVRMDAIIRAREALGFSTKISELNLLREALKTTPRFVWKVSKQLVIDKPSRIFLVIPIGVYEQLRSFLRWLCGCISISSKT